MADVILGIRDETRQNSKSLFFSASNSPTIDNNQQHITVRTHLDLLSIPKSGRESVKTFRWDHRLQIQNLFMTFKRVPLW